MESFRIYGKTELGAAALTAARGTISSSARQLLILIDGQRDVGELRGIFGEEALGRLLPQLEMQGYVNYLRDSAGDDATPAATVSRAPVAATPATPSTPAAVSGNFLGKFLLGLGALAFSGGVWWFFGGASIPGFTPAPATGGTAAAPASPPGAGALPAAAETPIAPPTALADDRVAARASDAGRADVRAEGRTAPRPELRSETRPDPRTDGRTDTRGSAQPDKGPAANPLPSAAGAVATARAVAAIPITPASDAPRSAVAAPPAGASPAGAPPAATAGTAPAPVATPQAAAAAPANAGNGVPPATAANAATPAAAPPAAPGNAATPAPARPVAPAASAAPALHARERTMPVLSRNARRAGIETGELVVRLHVSARGTVDAIDVVKAVPRAVYDPSVEQTLKTWTYDPPGIPVETTVAFSFKS